MKLVWISPAGAGAETVRALVSAGHSVVAWGADVGAQTVTQGALAPFCKAADLVVVDGPFTLDRTKRSWKPSVASLFFDELRRKHAVPALGPTPTVDLLVGDARYFKKWCGRLGLPYEPSSLDPAGEPWSSGGWFVGEEVVPPGPYLNAWLPLFNGVGFRGWFELRGGTGIPSACAAPWNATSIPEGRELDFLLSLATR